MKKIYNDEMWGFGEIIEEDGDKVLVRFDSDPWFPKWRKIKDDPRGSIVEVR